MKERGEKKKKRKKNTLVTFKTKTTTITKYKNKILMKKLKNFYVTPTVPKRKKSIPKS